MRRLKLRRRFADLTHTGWRPQILEFPLSHVDAELFAVVSAERARQRRGLSLFAPSMVVPTAVREAMAADFVNLDGEGYIDQSLREHLGDPSAFASAYYSGHAKRYNLAGPNADYVEALAGARLAEILAKGAPVGSSQLHVNVQPLSGSVANLAILRGLLPRGGRLLGLRLADGGHLSHGAAFHSSGQLFAASAVSAIGPDGTFAIDRVATALDKDVPDVIIIGSSSYPRSIPWRAVRTLLDGLPRPPILVADIAHFVGLVASGLYENPVGVADVVSFVGYKTLGGPRAGAIVTHHDDLASKISRALFPGIQSGPSLSAIAGLACAAKFASTAPFDDLMRRAVTNAGALAEELRRCGIEVAFGGTETHMLVLELDTPTMPIVLSMERAGLFLNSNLLPTDTRPQDARGLRLGLVGITQRGATQKDMPRLAEVIEHAASVLRTGGETGVAAVRANVHELAARLDRRNGETPVRFWR